MSNKRIDKAILESLTFLGDAECGRLLRSALKYSATGEGEELKGNERYVWPVLKGLIDRNLEELAPVAPSAESEDMTALPEFNREDALRLHEVTGDWNAVADMYGMSRTTLYRRMKQGADVSNRVSNVSLETSNVSPMFHETRDETNETRKESTPPVREEREEKERKKQRKNKEEIEESQTPTKEKNNDIARPRTDGMSKKMQADFDAFWAAYPKKVGKGVARKSFIRAMGKGVDLQTLLDAIERQRNCRQWTKDGNEFIPHPSTWLNQERWEDVIEDEQPVSATYRGNQVTVTKDWGIVYDY